MNRDKPGTLDSLREAASILAKPLEGPVNAMMDAFYGVDVRVSANVKRGTSYYSDRHEGTNRRVLFVHPLDALFTDYNGEPSAHLEEALEWIYERARVELDQVELAAADRAFHAGQAQQARMDLWMFDHGVTEHHLRAAVILHDHRMIRGTPGPYTVAELAKRLRMVTK